VSPFVANTERGKADDTQSNLTYPYQASRRLLNSYSMPLSHSAVIPPSTHATQRGEAESATPTRKIQPLKFTANCSKSWHRRDPLTFHVALDISSISRMLDEISFSKKRFGALFQIDLRLNENNVFTDALLSQNWKKK